MDLASLGIRIDSSAAREAVSTLDKLAAVGSKVEGAIAKVESENRKLSKSMTDGEKAVARNSKSIDEYVKGLQKAAATSGFSARETKLYELALKGANAAQLQAADSAIRMSEGYQKGVLIGDKIKTGFLAAAAAASALAVAGVAIGRNAINALADFKDLSEATGASIENISALDRQARQSGGSFDTVSTSLLKFNQVLSNLDGKNDASRILKELGLNAQALKDIDPAEALRLTAVALGKYADDGNKARAVQELFGKSVKEVGPFLHDLAEQTTLVATANAESARQADVFNKQLAALKANSEDTARSIVTDLLPALNRFLQNYREIKDAGGFGTIIKDAAKDLFSFGNANELTGNNGADINRLLKEREELTNAEPPDPAFAEAFKRDIDSRVVAINKYLTVLRIKQKNEILGANAGDTGDAISRLGRSAPSLKVPEKAGKVDKTAAQEAKAQLALDIEKIKIGGEALVSAYGNAEKILDARRAAGLVDEREYYEAKRGFLNLNTQAQQDALSAELARLEKEQLSGAKSIDNERKIADVKARLAKLDANAGTAGVVLSTQREAAAQKLAQYYRDAEDAAQSYLDTIIKAQQRELAGFGAGSQERDRTSGRAQIEDKYTEQRRALDKSKRDAELSSPEGTLSAAAQDKYEHELALIRTFQAKALAEYDEGFKKRLALQQDWQIGASEALRNYYTDSQNIAKQTEELFTNAFKGMEDALVSFVTTGKLDFKSLAQSIIADIARIIVKQQISNALGVAGGAGGILGSLIAAFTGVDNTALPTGDFARLDRRAMGGPVTGGTPYIVGEKGQELFVPRTAGTIISNEALTSGGSGAPVSVQVSVDASGTSVQGNGEKADQLGKRIGDAVRGVIMQEKMPGGMLA